MVNDKTKERYTALWNKIKANNVNLADLNKMTMSEFYNKIGSNAKSDGQFKLAKSLARNIERQSDVNTYLDNKKLPKSIIPRITEKQYIPEAYILRFKKSDYGLVGFNKKTAFKEYQTRNQHDIGVKLTEFKDKIKSSNSKDLKNPTGMKQYSVNQKTEVQITNPDGTIEIKTFYYNGKLWHDLDRSLNQTYKAKKKLRKFIEQYGRNNVIIGNTTFSIREIY